MLAHTGKNKGAGVDPWDTEQQERFLGNASKQILVFDFADKNGLERAKVKPTNLKRVLDNLHARDTIGISFSDGKMEYTKPEPEVKRNIKKVLAKMSKTSFNVSEIYHKKEIEPWIDGVLGIRKNADKTNGDSDSKNTTRTSPKSTDRTNLIPDNCHLSIPVPKINDIYHELKEDLSLRGPKSAPNSVGVIFRVFLEVSINHYLENKMGVKPDSNIHIIKKIQKVAKYMENNGFAKKEQLSGIRQTSAGNKTDILHIQRFHDYVHSGTIQPDPTSLKIKWNNVQEFFEILWNEPQKKDNDVT